MNRREFSKGLLSASMLGSIGAVSYGSGVRANHQNEIVANIGDCSVTFVKIPPGYGIVGSRNALFLEEGRSPKFRPIEISKGFYISKYLLTLTDKKSLKDAGVLSPETETENFFVKYSPKTAIYFSPWEIAPICLAFSKLLDANVTLPTEAQWEYACRAGSELNFYNGDDEESLKRIAWYDGTVQKDFWGNTIRPEIGLLEPNDFGLYDMLGLMGEPCIDDISYTDAIIDPVGRRSSPPRFRGGDPNYYPATVRGGFLVYPASRNTCHYSLKYRVSNLGAPPAGLRMVINDG